MSKTLVTYPDGSELTVNGVAGAFVAGMTVAAAVTFIREWRRSRKLGIKMWH